VTRRRTRGTADQQYVPDEGLINRYALTYGWEPSKLTTVLFQFGRLPKTGQEQLIRCLVLARGRYQWLVETERPPKLSNQRKLTLSNLRNQLRAVEKFTEKLLLQFGVYPKDVAPRTLWGRSSDRPASERLRSLGKQKPEGVSVTNWLAFAGLNTADRDEATVNAELKEASNNVAGAVIALLDLHDRAKTAMQTATKGIAPVRGGSRHRPRAKGQLIRDSIKIYAHMRGAHPDSGHKLGYGGPMLRFIHSVATLFGAAVRKTDIHEVWRLWKSNLK
jgi:hypothetical protein